jgi:hypothetical protein
VYGPMHTGFSAQALTNACDVGGCYPHHCQNLGWF